MLIRLGIFTPHEWPWSVNMLANYKPYPRKLPRGRLKCKPIFWLEVVRRIQMESKGFSRPLQVCYIADNLFYDASTLSAAYDEVITSVANCAQGHMNNADILNNETIETLKRLSRRNDEAKKKVFRIFTWLLSILKFIRYWPFFRSCFPNEIGYSLIALRYAKLLEW